MALTNTYSFVIGYVNNTQANNTNLHKRCLKNFKKCNLCGGNQTIGHVVGGCQDPLDEKW